MPEKSILSPLEVFPGWVEVAFSNLICVFHRQPWHLSNLGTVEWARLATVHLQKVSWSRAVQSGVGDHWNPCVRQISSQAVDGAKVALCLC